MTIKLSTLVRDRDTEFTTINLLQANNNLSDVDSAPSSLQNLGLTATAAELNTLDGITANVNELNILDGVTANTDEINILTGITANTSEINVLTGITANTAELNYNDITTLGTVEPSKTVTADANGDITSSEVITANNFVDVAGQVRAIPQSGSAKTASYSLQTSDVGQFIEVGANGDITIPDATFSAGDAVVLFNNTSGDVTVTCDITTAYIAGTDTDVASATLSTRGICNILFVSGTVCVITGNIV